MWNANELWSEENEGYFLDGGKKSTDEEGIVINYSLENKFTRLIFMLVWLKPFQIYNTWRIP